MPVFVSMLRGINVGGRNKIKMEALRALCDSLGLNEPRTLLQSGNVVFSTAETNSSRLSKRIEEGIDTRFGIRVEVILRSLAELRSAVSEDPFPAEQESDPSHVLAMFLTADPDEAARARLLRKHQGPERLRFSGRELFLYYPNGIGRSKLTNALIEDTLNVTGTARNWKTVSKLLALAQGL